MKVRDVANEILRAFTNPKTLPSPLPTPFIRRRAKVPCRSWSWRNRVTTALHCHTDARSYDQWQQVGRYVRRGEKAFYIEPQIVKPTSKWLPLRFGPRGAPVFGFTQTEGEVVPVPVCDLEIDRWLQRLPLRIVADLWGISVEAFNGISAGKWGCYHASCDGLAIALGVKHSFVWAHELVHAADHRNGTMKEIGEHWRKETVAAFGSAIMLKALGYDHEANLGWNWRYICHYVEKENLEVVKACTLALERTCEAVTLILDAYHDFRKEIMWEKMA